MEVGGIAGCYELPVVMNRQLYRIAGCDESPVVTNRRLSS